MDIIRKYSKPHRHQKQKYATASKNKNAQWEKPASLNILYYATISWDDESYKLKLYKGIFETTFKKRYANHKKSFSVEKNKNDAKLSTEYWKLTNNKLHPQISWSMKGNFKWYNPNSKRCSLCLHEKLEIVEHRSDKAYRIIIYVYIYIYIMIYILCIFVNNYIHIINRRKETSNGWINWYTVKTNYF